MGWGGVEVRWRWGGGGVEEVGQGGAGRGGAGWGGVGRGGVGWGKRLGGSEMYVCQFVHSAQPRAGNRSAVVSGVWRVTEEEKAVQTGGQGGCDGSGGDGGGDG